MSKILFAAKIAFGGEDRGMPEQELDLFQLSAVGMAQLCTGPAQIMGRDMVQSYSFTAASNYVPDHVLRDSRAPDFAASGHGTENLSIPDPCG